MADEKSINKAVHTMFRAKRVEKRDMANTKKLAGKKVAIVATDGFEWSELTEPKEALEKEGADVDIISPKSGRITGETKGEKAGEVDVTVPVSEADAQAYDALLLPGGVKNPDSLRLSEGAIIFIKRFVDEDKPIAAICHGPWTLINAGGVEGKRVTSWPSLQSDLENAGAQWEDEEVIVDGTLVTSRKPDDIPAFNREMIRLFADA